MDTEEIDNALIATELARQKLRTEVEFVRRQLAYPDAWPPRELIDWARDKLDDAMKIEPIQNRPERRPLKLRKLSKPLKLDVADCDIKNGN